MKRVFLVVAAFSVFLLPAVAQAADVDGVVQELRALKASADLPAEWRILVGDGDASQMAAPDLDDSAWPLGSSWSGEPRVAWLRCKVTVPTMVGDLPAGYWPVTLDISVDDAGTLYLDGKLLGDFDWAGRFLLPSPLRPGQQVTLAVRAINRQGPASLRRLRLAILPQPGQPLTPASFAAQLAFAKAVAARNAGQHPDWPGLVEHAAEHLDLESLKATEPAKFGDLLQQALAMLAPLGPAAKEYTIHLVGHAHIDMNWLWLWPETVEVCFLTFSNALEFMQEFPGYKFSQSQVSTYEAMQNYHPEVFKSIGEAMKPGQWETTAATWVEGDTNMASGEALVRHTLYSSRYMQEHFGVSSEVLWLPDNFGHARTLPTIMSRSGIKYFYFTRCGTGAPLFWWEGPDGSRLLAFSLGGYIASVNDGVTWGPLTMEEATGLKHYMLVYGVGDHGGGPTRQDLETVREMQSRPIWPTMVYDTADHFYRTAQEQVAARGKPGPELPVHRTELNYVFRGGYTSHSDIKRMNRELENLLPQAEAVSALAALYGGNYPKKELARAWENALFNQFHDILCGTAIHDAYEYSRGLYDQAEKTGQATLREGLKTLAENVNTQGVKRSVIVFNPSSWARTDLVTVPDLPNEVTAVSDAAGNVAPVQRDEGGNALFVATDVPPLGYKAYWPSAVAPTQRVASASESGVLENAFLRATVNMESGGVVSLFDRAHFRQCIAPGQEAGALIALWESQEGNSAWDIGKIVGREALTHPEYVHVVERGPVRATIEARYKYSNSTLTQRISLVAGAPRLVFSLTADWQEVGSPEKGGPMIKAEFPLNLTNPKAYFEIPFGAIERPASGDEVPALRWVDLSGSSGRAGGALRGISLLNDCKYGHDVTDSTVHLTLLRCSYSPDPRPDVGTHHIGYALFPHEQGFAEGGTFRQAEEFNVPVLAALTDEHPGPLDPSGGSFARVENDDLIVSALKQAEDGTDLVLRLYEISGRDGIARVHLGFPVRAATETDNLEQPLKEGTAKVVQASGRSKQQGAVATVNYTPYDIVTLRITPGR